MHYFTGRCDRYDTFQSLEELVQMITGACQLTPTSCADKTYSAILRFVHQKFQKWGQEGASSSELGTLPGFTSHSRWPRRWLTWSPPNFLFMSKLVRNFSGKGQIIERESERGEKCQAEVRRNINIKLLRPGTWCRKIQVASPSSQSSDTNWIDTSTLGGPVRNCYCFVRIECSAFSARITLTNNPRCAQVTKYRIKQQLRKIAQNNLIVQVEQKASIYHVPHMDREWVLWSLDSWLWHKVARGQWKRIIV